MNTTTQKLTVTGALIALDVVLTRLLAVNTAVMKIGIGFLAVAVCAGLYGPVWAAVCGAAADLTGALLFPTGAYFPGFTLTAALTGVLFGLLLKNYTKPGAAAAAVLNCVLISYLANTFLISRISGTSYTKLLAARAVQLAVGLPLQTVLLVVVLPVIIQQLNRIKWKNKEKNKKSS